MKFFVVIFIITKFFSFCGGDTHSWGERPAYYAHRMYERILIDDQNSIPKDYTIIYKYYGALYRKVSYIEIDVNTNSSGYIHVSHVNQKSYFETPETVQVFDAKVHIKNALNVEGTLRIYGMESSMGYIGGLRKLYETKSLAFVHKRTSNVDNSHKTYAQNSIGKRRKRDEWLHFESRNITNNSRFPSRAFQYSSGAYITYVGFSFNSPTAMVMVNTTYVDEQEFSAVVYDMNTEHFVANMSVYGIKSSDRPSGFLGVI